MVLDVDVEECKWIHIHQPTPNSSPRIKGLNIKPDTLNLTERKVRPSLEWIGTGDNFVGCIPTAKSLRANINNSDLIN